MLKTTLACLAAAAAMAGSAHAQTSPLCSMVQKAVAAAPADFRSVRGAATGDGFYATSVGMQGAECELFNLDSDWEWSCYWRGPSGEGQPQGANLFVQVGNCLPGWKVVSYAASRRKPSGRVTARWEGRYEGQDVVVRIEGSERTSPRLGAHSEVQLIVHKDY